MRLNLKFKQKALATSLTIEVIQQHNQKQLVKQKFIEIKQLGMLYIIQQQKSYLLLNYLFWYKLLIHQSKDNCIKYYKQILRQEFDLTRSNMIKILNKQSQFRQVSQQMLVEQKAKKQNTVVQCFKIECMIEANYQKVSMFQFTKKWLKKVKPKKRRIHQQYGDNRRNMYIFTS